MKIEILYLIREVLIKLINHSIENEFDKERLICTVKMYIDIHIEKDKEKCKETAKKKNKISLKLILL